MVNATESLHHHSRRHQQCIYILHRIYSSATERILAACVSGWAGGRSAPHTRRTEKITRPHSLQGLALKRCRSWATKPIGDCSSPPTVDRFPCWPLERGPSVSGAGPRALRLTISKDLHHTRVHLLKDTVIPPQNNPTFPVFQSESPKKQSNWHKKHEDIMANPRAVRTFALTMKDGGSLPPPPPTYDQGNRQGTIENHGNAQFLIMLSIFLCF